MDGRSGYPGTWQFAILIEDFLSRIFKNAEERCLLPFTVCLFLEQGFLELLNELRLFFLVCLVEGLHEIGKQAQEDATEVGCFSE